MHYCRGHLEPELPLEKDCSFRSIRLHGAGKAERYKHSICARASKSQRALEGAAAGVHDQ